MNSTKSLQCEFCGKCLRNIYNLKRHYTKVHSITDPDSQSKSLKCSICKCFFTTFNSFCEHLSNHNIKVEIEDWKFKTESEFQEWKNSVQERDCVSFVKKTGKLYSEGHVIFFRCNRSGDYKSRVTDPNKRKKEIRSQGSHKINAYCPCRIRHTLKRDGSVYASYCKTHVGHEIELSHIPLSTHERQELAKKLSSNLPLDTVLEDIQNSVTCTQPLKRKHLLKKGDLQNIKKEFGLDEDITHSGETSNVDKWVQQELLSDRNYFFFYKQKGKVLIEYPHLKRDDFALGIMTEAQTDMLKKYWSNCIFIDSALQGISPYNYQMTTVLVSDDFRQGFPCAFFIFNHRTSENNKVLLKTFFNCLKIIVGPIQPKLVMTDIAEELYSAWFDVMGESFIHLFCKFNVNRAWQRNLTKIRNCNLRNEAYNKLRTLQHERDELAFKKMLPIVVKSLCENKETEKFGNYFKSQFVKSVRQWAFCYRKSTGISVDNSLQKMHSQIKNLFLKGKSIKRLDNTMRSLMQFVSKKHSYHLLSIEKGGERVFVRSLMSCHNKSLSLNSDLVKKHSENSWDVSSTTKEIFRVKLVKNKCDCSLVCTACKSCIHKFNCTCVDASVRWSMCEHIHLVARTQAKSLDESNNDTAIQIEQVFSLNKRNPILIDLNIIETLTVDSSPHNMEQQKIAIMKQKAIEDLYSIMQGANSIAEVQFIRDQIKNITPQMPTDN